MSRLYVIYVSDVFSKHGRVHRPCKFARLESWRSTHNIVVFAHAPPPEIDETTVFSVKKYFFVLHLFRRFPFRIFNGTLELELQPKLVGKKMLCPDLCTLENPTPSNDDIVRLVKVKRSMSRCRSLAFVDIRPIVEVRDTSGLLGMLLALFCYSREGSTC